MKPDDDIERDIRLLEAGFFCLWGILALVGWVFVFQGIILGWFWASCWSYCLGRDWNRWWITR